uniref:Uncharacterized protein n=1 Tax=viral metagenome TaxID=1070528 RepID=A0A6C0LNK1_9ZZZZ
MKQCTFSLLNKTNYNANLEDSIIEILNKYASLTIKYVLYLSEAGIFSKNKRELTLFITTRGVDTLTHIFLNLLFYTNNSAVTYFHSEKSFYFYIEFVSQISHEDKSFLQLSSRDACNYVYKKTIFDLQKDMKHSINEDESTIKKHDTISNSIHILKISFNKLLLKTVTEKKHQHSDLTLFYDMVNHFNTLDLVNTDFKTLSIMIEYLDNNVTDIERFFKLKIVLLKKIKLGEIHLLKFKPKPNNACEAFINDMIVKNK